MKRVLHEFRYTNLEAVRDVRYGLYGAYVAARNGVSICFANVRIGIGRH